MGKGQFYDEELLARYLKQKELLDDESLARARRVRAGLYKYELPRPLDRILLDLGLVDAKDLEEGVKASTISDAQTEHIPIAVMAGEAAKADTQKREKLDAMREKLETPKKAADHAGVARPVPPVGIIAVCAAVTVVALTVLVVRLLPPKIEPVRETEPRDFEPYAVEDEYEDLLGRVGFMPTAPGLVFVERPDGETVGFEWRRVCEDALAVAGEASERKDALAALRVGMRLARSKEKRAEFLLAAAERAGEGLALKLIGRLREDYGEETRLVARSYIVEAGKAPDSYPACRAYRAYLERYPDGELAQAAHEGLSAAGSSVEYLPQPEEKPVWPEGSAVAAIPFGPGAPGWRGEIEERLDPGPRDKVLAAVRGPDADERLRAFVVLEDEKEARPKTRLGFRAWASCEGGCVVEVSVLALRGEQDDWLGFRRELEPRWQSLSLPLGALAGARVHSVSFVAPAEAEGLYIDELVLFEPPE